MRIGIIGAGRMGFTLGKHFVLGGLDVAGYYSRSSESAGAAAEFTNTGCYETMEALAEACDTIFLTVPDGQIAPVANALDAHADIMEGKRICHTSGALSSHIFSGMKSRIYGYSIHPIYATNDKYSSYENFRNSYITIEGDHAYVRDFVLMFEKLGHTCRIISAEDKTRYHASCVMASNLVIGLYKLATDNLTQCGFSLKDAEQALKPLFQNNAENLLHYGMEDALTGPVARGDTGTVKKHLEVLEGTSLEAYKALTQALVDLKHEEDFWKKEGVL